MAWRLVVLAAMVLLVGHWALRSHSVSWLPLPITAAALIAYVAERPVRALIGLAIIGELLGALPGGLMTLVVFLPWLIQRLDRHREHKAWYMFLGTVTGAVLLQVLVLSQAWTWLAGWWYVPWPTVLVTWVSCTIVVFLLASGLQIWGEARYER